MRSVVTDFRRQSDRGAARSLRCRRPMQLALEGGDVAPAEAPLPALLEGRKNALACELVDGVRAEIQESRDLPQHLDVLDGVDAEHYP